MALDQQSNWNIEMSQPCQITSRSKIARTITPPPILLPSTSDREVLLPVEIISHILSYIPRRQSTEETFRACTHVSRAWYAASIAVLYERPYLTGSNFSQFVATVCPSKNAHIRLSSLATLVRRLDMGDLVHDSSRSLTARLLGRLKGNLEGFVAPQTSFAINSFAALSKCTKLTYLDLSLISASISNKILFRSLESLQRLETLFFPRSSSLDTEKTHVPYSWPPKLKVLHLAGGIDDHFLETHLTNIGLNLEKLSIQHCSHIYPDALLKTLSKVGLQLKHLTVRHPMGRLASGTLDHILLLCPKLTAFRISADYITSSLFLCVPSGHPLRILDLDCSPQAGAEVEISPTAVYNAVEDGNLSNLRSVRVSARLAWTATEGLKTDVSDLAEIMDENDMENPLGIEVCVWPSMPD